MLSDDRKRFTLGDLMEDAQLRRRQVSLGIHRRPTLDPSRTRHREGRRRSTTILSGHWFRSQRPSVHDDPMANPIGPPDRTVDRHPLPLPSTMLDRSYSVRALWPSGSVMVPHLTLCTTALAWQLP